MINTIEILYISKFVFDFEILKNTNCYNVQNEYVG